MPPPLRLLRDTIRLAMILRRCYATLRRSDFRAIFATPYATSHYAAPMPPLFAAFRRQRFSDFAFTSPLLIRRFHTPRATFRLMPTPRFMDASFRYFAASAISLCYAYVTIFADICFTPTIDSHCGDDTTPPPRLFFFRHATFFSLSFSPAFMPPFRR